MPHGQSARLCMRPLYDCWTVEFRMHERWAKLPVVRQEEDAGRVPVEPSHRIDALPAAHHAP